MCEGSDQLPYVHQTVGSFLECKYMQQRKGKLTLVKISQLKCEYCTYKAILMMEFSLVPDGFEKVFSKEP